MGEKYSDHVHDHEHVANCRLEDILIPVVLYGFELGLILLRTPLLKSSFQYLGISPLSLTAC